jgi:hypothetical protein
MAISVGLLAYSFHQAYRRDRTCAVDGCDVPRSIRRRRLTVWVVTVGVCRDHQILRHLPAVMQVSGGLVLAAMGWRLLNQDEAAPAATQSGAVPNPDVPPLESRSFYPLTFPITAGPGCIVVVITLSAQASAQRGRRPETC